MTIVISGNLLRFSNMQHEISTPALTVIDGVHQLIEQYPRLAPVLLDGEGEVRRVHRLFLNGNAVPRDELAQVVCEDDELAILTAIAGG